MKIEELKNLLKQVVKEVFQEELKGILIEALKSNKSNVIEGIVHTSPQLQNPASNKKHPIKTSYMDIINEMKAGPKSPLDGEIQIPKGEVDLLSEGSSLPQGSLSLEQIMNLTNKK